MITHIFFSFSLKKKKEIFLLVPHWRKYIHVIKLL